LVAQDDKIGTNDYLVSALLNQYRVHLKTTRKSGAPGVFEVMARRFAVTFGKKNVCELKPYDFDKWLNEQETWNATTKAHAIALILAAITWAKRKGFIVNDPLSRKIERHQPILRGRDARLQEGLMDLLIGECFEKATYNRQNRTDTPGGPPEKLRLHREVRQVILSVAGIDTFLLKGCSIERSESDGLPSLPS